MHGDLDHHHFPPASDMAAVAINSNHCADQMAAASPIVHHHHHHQLQHQHHHQSQHHPPHHRPYDQSPVPSSFGGPNGAGHNMLPARSHMQPPQQKPAPIDQFGPGPFPTQLDDHHHHHHNHHNHHHNHNHQHHHAAPHLNQHNSPNHSQLHPGTQLSPTSATNHTSSNRLTLPLRDLPVLGPFRLDHDAHHTTKVFHIKPQLFETLRKSFTAMNPQTATVIQELQFRAYISGGGGGGQANKTIITSNSDSLLASRSCASSAAATASTSCNWPEMFQVMVNQQIVHLDRSTNKSSNKHYPVNIFQYCQIGDNTLEIKVNDCYCTHEFVIEAVDRPTMKAFMNSCFKSRLMKVDDCLHKLGYNFGSPGFIIVPQQQQHMQSAGIHNEYITDYSHGMEYVKARISLKCPITLRRMRTPTRGHNCKHLQCFDLENFLTLNHDRTQWHCPLCSLSIAFNLLELDQHQINITQAMSDVHDTDDILIDAYGEWHSYHQAPIHQPPPAIAPNSLPAPGQRRYNHDASQPLPPMRAQQQQQPPQFATAMHNHRPPPTDHIIQPPPQQHPMPPQSPYHQQAPMTKQQHPTDTYGGGPPAMAAQHTMPPARPPSSSHLHLNLNLNQQPQQYQQHSPKGPMSGFSPVTGGSGRAASSSQAPMASVRSPSSWTDEPQQQLGGAVRRPASAFSGPNQQTLVRPPSVKKPYLGPQAASIAPALSQQQPISAPQPTSAMDNIDELSPLAAMERTIIQHEQQMGPPPFDPNNLSLGSASRSNAGVSNQQQQPQPKIISNSAANMDSSTGNNLPDSMISNSSNSNVLPASHQSPQQTCYSPSARVASPVRQAPIGARVGSPHQPQRSPLAQQTRPTNYNQSASMTSASPISRSPLAQHQHQQQPQQTNVQPPVTQISSTPNTPSSTILAHGAPDTPATPGNPGPHPQQQHPVLVSGQTPMHVVGSSGTNGSSTGVDHQPLSNGSASAGSITSTSTMTPGGQSLGSVGMGGDSRCNTAPLQTNGSHSLDDLLASGGSSGQCGSGQVIYDSNNGGSGDCKQQPQGSGGGARASSQNMDEKNEILMSKLMMDSNSESMLRDDHRQNSHDLAMSLEDADWKQQLDKGKSEHLANFLNEPLMTKHNSAQQQKQQVANGELGRRMTAPAQQQQGESGDKTTSSGGINTTIASGDETNGLTRAGEAQPQHETSLDQNNLDQSQDFVCNYLDPDSVDIGAGLPPDDSILDLFER